MDKNTHIYDKLRAMLGGKLTNAQFIAARNIIDSGFRSDYRISLGLAPEQSDDQRTSLKGQNFIKGYEKCKLTAYMPTKNDRPTIGWGTTFYEDGSPVKMGQTITQARADELFAHDLRKFEDVVNETITVQLTQGQFDALVSLVYNIGAGAFRAGSIDDKINAGNLAAARLTWVQYNKQAGKVLDGLTKRRNAELVQLFNA